MKEARLERVNRLFKDTGRIGSRDALWLIEHIYALELEVSHLQDIIDRSGIITGEDAERFVEALRNPKPLSPEQCKRLGLDEPEQQKAIKRLVDDAVN